MKKITMPFLALFLISLLALAGCSGSNSKVNDGVNNMLDTTKQLSQAIDADDQSKASKVGPKLEDQWSVFEDEVKKIDKASYEEIEKYLDPTIAGSKAKELDQQALSSLNNQLRNALKELQKAVK